ncbi:MAG: GLPGLI family protein [Saprospiraceae bacterium]
MRASFIAITLVFLSTCVGIGQQAPVQAEGKIRYLLTHNWTKKYAGLDYISQQRKERNAYMWGGSRSEWKEYADLYITPMASKYEESDEKAEDDDYGYSWRKETFVLRKNFETGMFKDHIEFLGKKYVIEDSIQVQDWKILNDLKEVAGHVCMNAVWEDTLKQQTVEVWFALDIPHSGGPEQLCGLPGLILEANINNGALLIEAQKIDWMTLTNEMDEPKKMKGKRINEAAYNELLKKHIEEKKKNEEPWFWGIRYF